MDASEIEQRITFEALAAHFNKMREWAAFTVVVPLTVVLVLWNQVDQWLLLGWFCLVLGGIGVRFLLTSAYGKQDITPKTAHPWHRKLLIIQIYMGVLWAIAVLAFSTPLSPPHQVFMITLALILGIGSISSGAYWLPLYYSYGLPIKTALAAHFATLGEFAWLALAVMVTFAIVASYNVAKKLNVIVRSEMHLRLESAELVTQLEERGRELQSAIRAKSDLLATASHDFRQPLHALSLFFGALKITGSAREEIHILSRIDAALDTMRKMFDGLFDISRLDANIVQPEPVDFDIETFLLQLQEEFAEKALQKRLSLRLYARPAVVRADQILLGRVLRNLIANAIRYTRSGGVLISARPRQDSVLLQVWDTGIGIPEEARQRVFLEFQQLHPSHQENEGEKGLGFGLAIVHKLCKLMDLPLTLDSVEERGSVFSLRVPLGDLARLKQVQQSAVVPAWQASGQHILVIDDDQDVLNAMQTLLSQWHFRVTAVASLAEALPSMAGHAPDLVLVDFSLDGPHNGLEVMRRLRESFGTDLPGILVTGMTSSRHLRQAEEDGLGLVHKPVCPAMLRSIIQHYLTTTSAMH